MSEYNGPYPLRYFSGRRGIKSDRDNILLKMPMVTKSKRQEVADNYDRIYTGYDCELTREYVKRFGDNRNAANEYLEEQASKTTSRIGGTFFDNFG